MKKILVIDDSKTMLSIVDIFLTDNHYIVKTISRWPVIQRTIDSFMPDLILLDIDLNGADGGDICRHLKQNGKDFATPIILFSAYNMPDEYIKDSYAQGFLRKPFVSSELVKIMRDILTA